MMFNASICRKASKRQHDRGSATQRYSSLSDSPRANGLDLNPSSSENDGGMWQDHIWREGKT